jgi:hypothetical protein
MNIKNSTTVRLRLAVLVIGFFGAVTGLPFGFSSGQINLMPISGLTYANSLSGIVIGTLGMLIFLAEVAQLCKYKKNLKSQF